MDPLFNVYTPYYCHGEFAANHSDAIMVSWHLRFRNLRRVEMARPAVLRGWGLKSDLSFLGN
jgi:hypothetical protein